MTAIDIAEAAVETARDRCADVTNVDVHQGSLPDDVPAGPFDLIVFREIGYYFTRPELIELGETLASRIEPRGQLLAVHWTGASPDHILGGPEVHDILGKFLPLEHLHHETHPCDEQDGFALDIWRRPSPDSC